MSKFEENDGRSDRTEDMEDDDNDNGASSNETESEQEAKDLAAGSCYWYLVEC